MLSVTTPEHQSPPTRVQEATAIVSDNTLPSRNAADVLDTTMDEHSFDDILSDFASVTPPPPQPPPLAPTQ